MSRSYLPWFLVSSVRSGSTLLRLMLDHHPRIRCVGEADYLTDLLAGLPEGQWPDAQAYRTYLKSEWIFQAHQLQVSESLDYQAQAFDFMDQHAARSDAPLVGAAIHRHYVNLLRLWPDAKFINLVRDGRDVARSIHQLGWAGTMWGATQYWLDAEANYQELASRVKPQQIMTVYHEALIEDHVGELTRICEFLGDQYEPAMMDYSKTSTYDAPNPGMCYQWKSKLPARQLQLLEYRIGDLLVQHGYELSGQPRIQLSAFQKAMLRIQDRWGRVQSRQKQFGLRWWLESLIADRLGSRRWRERLDRHRNAIIEKQLK